MEFRMGMLLGLLVGSLLGSLVVEKCKADDYIVLSAGTARLSNRGVNGIWYQEGFDYQHYGSGPTYSVGIGKRLNEYLSIEADYRDLGTFDGIVRYVPDDNYNPTTGHCIGTCEATESAMVRSDSKGISINGILNLYDSRITPYVRGGALFYTSKTTVLMVYHPESLSGRSLNRIAVKRSYLVTPEIGAGVTVGNFFAEYRIAYKVGGSNAPMQRGETFTVGYRAEF